MDNIPKTGHWYWKGGANPWSAMAADDWKPYSDQDNQSIEKAFLDKRESVIIGSYILNLNHCTQVSRSDVSKQRPIKRVTPGEKV
jgi:hypothetical protein